MNGRKPSKAEKEWFLAIQEYGCIACKDDIGVWSPSEVHHINGGDNHLETLPLCAIHHRGGANCSEYVSRHPWKTEFETRYGSDAELLAQLRDKLGY